MPKGGERVKHRASPRGSMFRKSRGGSVPQTVSRQVLYFAGRTWTFKQFSVYMKAHPTGPGKR
jgi:hypothetical protein